MKMGPSAAVVLDSAPHDGEDVEEKIVAEEEFPSLPEIGSEGGSASGSLKDSNNNSNSNSNNDLKETYAAEELPPPQDGAASGGESSEEEEEEEGEDSNNDDLKDEEDENNDGLSEYERVRLFRIQRNQARLRELGLLNEDDGTLTNIKSGSSKKKAERKSATPHNNTTAPARRQPKREVKSKIPQEQMAWLGPSSAFKNKSSNSKIRCGECAGCTREDDCNTCVFCVERINGKAKPRRCIFKACRKNNNNDNTKNAQEQTNDPKQQANNEKEEQEHSDHCDVCQNGGDLILCDTCPRGFHSNCHVPKIKKIPSDDEVWLCMECNPRSRSTGFLWALLPDTTKLIKVKVIEPAPECMICQDACADPESIQCKACDNRFHLWCQDLEQKPKGGAARVWKCATCKAANAPLLEHHVASAKPPKKKNLNLFEGEHDDDCYICFNGGELVCCDFCPKVFHRDCHIPALPAIPTGIWKCCECYASERNRMTRCGDCKACRAEDCGKCKFCLDRPKFGGPNRLKKPCIKRECPYQSFAETFVAGKIPGEIAHLPSAAKKSQKKRRRDSDASNLQGEKKRAKTA